MCIQMGDLIHIEWIDIAYCLNERAANPVLVDGSFVEQFVQSIDLVTVVDPQNAVDVDTRRS